MSDETTTGPIGSTAREAAQRRARRSPEYRQLRDCNALYAEIAWLCIKHRMDNGLTQKELAEKLGTSHSQVSRIENAQHGINVETLMRLVDALDLKISIAQGRPTSSQRRKRRELVPA